MQFALRVALALLSMLVAAGVLAADGEQYMVELELWIDGEERGTPIVVVPPGEQASVEVGDPSGHGGWRIEVLVEPPAISEGAPTGATWLNLAVHELVDGQWEALTDSLLGLREGQPGTMTVVESGVEQGTRENSLVHLTAQVSRLRPGKSER